MGHGKYKNIGYVIECWEPVLKFRGYVKYVGKEIRYFKRMEDALIKDKRQAYNEMLYFFSSELTAMDLYLYPVIEDMDVACGRVKQIYLCSLCRMKDIE